ncbi:MAG: thiamine phosphate synthase [Alistipes sp.]|nr:thiamine phosphate synthase [Alistipes sp.]
MAHVQFITHTSARHTYADSARLALAGGCRWIQLRMKDAQREEIIATAAEILPLCREVGATFILDDHVELVELTGADGVHLGKNDMPIAEARRQLGHNKIIGGTANTFEDILAHAEAGADYIGCGPFRFTTTKKNLSPILGLEGYARIVEQMHQNNISLPIVAIGGIAFEDIPAILQTGVTGIALSGSVLRADDPIAEMRKIVEL